MVKYYGRARQRTGSVNTKQMGLKMAGCPPTVGKKGTIARYEARRVACGGAKRSCGLNGCNYTCRFGVSGCWGAPATTKYCQARPILPGLGCIKVASRTAARGGGVGNIWTPRSQ